MKSFLLLCAHVDDHIFASVCAKRLIDIGYTGYFMVFSISEKQVPLGFPKGTLLQETKNSLQKIGISVENTFVYSEETDILPSVRQKILQSLIDFQKNIVIPDIVFLSSSYDLHQDHATIYKEGIRGFRRNSTMFGYDFPWNAINAQNVNCFVEITQEELDYKIAVANCFQTQIRKQNNCISKEYLTAQAIVRGNQINKKYAEAFEFIRGVF